MRSYVAPLLEMVRPLRVSAFIPVAIALLGLTETMVMFVIAFGSIWPMLLATVHGFSSVEPRLFEVSRSCAWRDWRHREDIAAVGSPDILAGMRSGVTVSLILQ